jgi:hypothetical protein
LEIDFGFVTIPLKLVSLELKFDQHRNVDCASSAMPMTVFQVIGELTPHPRLVELLPVDRIGQPATSIA